MRLHHSQDLSDANVDIIGGVASFVDTAGQPAVIGGDVNMGPEVFETSGVAGRLQGQILTPGNVIGTCAGTGALKIYDYFLVSGGLEKAISEVRGVHSS
eukprot:4608494-Pyramimonas_sp.AAC.1